MSPTRRPALPTEAVAARALVGLAFGAFVVLGMPKTAFGVAWPTVADDLGRSIAELGVIIVVFTVGYVAGSALSGPAAERLGTGRALVAANAVTIAGLAGYAATPDWAVLLGAAVVLGLAGGVVDASINTYMALHRGARVMNLLHASFGVGATLGPLLMTAFLAWGGSWRAAYAVLAAAQLVLTFLFWRTRHRWDAGPVEERRRRPGAADRPRPALLGGTLTLFFLYSGVEVAAGVWATSLFTESRGLSEAAAGLAVTAYWGSFTAGRFVASVFGERFDAERVIPAAILAASGSLALLWWSPAGWVGPVALTMLGLALAPIFPALVLLTPPRVGASYAARAVGYQLAAASLGIAAIPGGAGLLVAWAGLETIPPFLLAATVALLAMNGAVGRMAGRAA